MKYLQAPINNCGHYDDVYFFKPNLEEQLELKFTIKLNEKLYMPLMEILWIKLHSTVLD